MSALDAVYYLTKSAFLAKVFEKSRSYYIAYTYNGAMPKSQKTHQEIDASLPVNKYFFRKGGCLGYEYQTQTGRTWAAIMIVPNDQQQTASFVIRLFINSWSINLALGNF